ncbi:10574_t:CDS:2 [Entrophospora sp. SA101]|nr:10574_t:CDS:2 [Entrophospora sp. SA101]
MANNDDNFLSSPVKHSSYIHTSKSSILTPHKISILLLIIIYFELSSGTAKLESLLFFLIERISREFRFPEPSLQEFCDEISNLQTPNDSIKLKEVLLKKFLP